MYSLMKVNVKNSDFEFAGQSILSRLLVMSCEVGCLPDQTKLYCLTVYFILQTAALTAAFAVAGAITSKVVGLTSLWPLLVRRDSPS